MGGYNEEDIEIEDKEDVPEFSVKLKLWNTLISYFPFIS